LLAAILLLPCAAATRLDARFHVEGDAVFHGQSNAQIQWTGSIQDARLGHRPQGSFWFHGTARLLNYTFADSQQAASSPTGYGRNVVLLSQTANDLHLVEGSLTIVAGTNNSSLRLIPAADLAVPISSSFSLTPARDPHNQLATSDDAQPIRDSGPYFPRPGGILKGQALHLANLSFDGRLVATGVIIATPTATIDTRWTTQGPDVPGIGWNHVRTTRVLVLDGSIRSASDLDPTDWSSAVESLSGDFQGDLVLQNSEGQGTMNGTALPQGIHLFQVAGNLQIQASDDLHHSEWQITGKPTFVAVNAVAVNGIRPGWGLELAATAGAAGLGALFFAFFTRIGRSLTGLVGGYNRAQPLGNPTRIQVLRTIAEEPGITATELQSRVGTSRTAIGFHLRILERASLIDVNAQGKSLHYQLNSGQYRFMQETLPNENQQQEFVKVRNVLAALRDPTRNFIFTELTRTGPTSYQELAGSWAKRGIPTYPSQSLFSHHARILEESGAIRGTKTGRATAWEVAVDVAKIFRTQSEAFLKHDHRKDLLDLATEMAPAKLETLIREAARRHHQSPPKIKAVLQDLYVFGFLNRTPEGYVPNRNGIFTHLTP
jgi:DNA-binding transcriptional ArsR family regulator